MDDKNFINQVSKIITHIAQFIERHDIDEKIDVDINGDILNIITEDGTFVINRQIFLKEIWLSSPITGPYHFAYDGKKWRSKAGDELFLVLSQDLKMDIGDLYH